MTKEEFKFPSAAEKLYRPSVTYHSRHSLLAAAMHNFHEHETRLWSLRQAHLEGPQGARLTLQFERFASLCRSLDIGAGYQALLNKVLLPKSGRGQPEGQARRAVEQLFEGCLQSRMQASVYESRFKGEIDESDLQRLLAWFNGQPEPAKGTLISRQLYLLGKCMIGAVTLEWRPAGSDEIDEVILWLPSDPQQTLWHYDSWAALYDGIALRLRQPAFRRFSVFSSRYRTERRSIRPWHRCSRLQRPAQRCSWMGGTCLSRATCSLMSERNRSGRSSMMHVSSPCRRTRKAIWPGRSACRACCRQGSIC